PRVVDDCPYPQSSAKNQSNRFLIQALRHGRQAAIHAVSVQDSCLPGPVEVVTRDRCPLFLHPAGDSLRSEGDAPEPM
ncbi:hypothetical protein, partial [Komagataeibacter oboediens]|uniref:hypothetical protein n=1 Tax=Komagataeibacter oboediens TaxID=65958 RepID=UPI001F44F2CC